MTHVDCLSEHRDDFRIYTHKIAMIINFTLFINHEDVMLYQLVEEEWRMKLK